MALPGKNLHWEIVTWEIGSGEVCQSEGGRLWVLRSAWQVSVAALGIMATMFFSIKSIVKTFSKRAIHWVGSGWSYKGP